MVTFSDVLAAQQLLAGHLPPTPMWSYPALNALAGATLYVKHENTQPIGAFKVRGGLTLLAGLPADRRRAGLVTYSTGNHAQSIAYACREFGVPCVVVMPAAASEEKARAVRALGATVELRGPDLAAAGARAEELAAAEGRLLISPGDTPELLAGVGTAYLEVFEAMPDLDALVVPVGSGTGAAAACVVAAKLAPACRVIAVQSAASPAAHDSWRAGAIVERPNATTVDGLATGRGFALPQQLMRGPVASRPANRSCERDDPRPRGLADFQLVTDDQIAAAQRVLATHAHTLAEGAGAAALAAVLARPDAYQGQRVGIVCSGGNASRAEIARLAAS